ncbi:MAG: tetratricopeptide repeat protein [Leptolyngbya sp. LCM1.Bin17]|nr:MAG: tetratricopeptide repeat protein [Leptolyngbya sp. LCM1.Bin17]
MALAHHYRILGLRTGASFEDVKLAYRNLARLYHPDLNPGNDQAKERFIQATQAYEALVAALPKVAVPRRSPQASVQSRPQASPQGSPQSSSRSQTQIPQPQIPKPAPAAETKLENTSTVQPVPGGSPVEQSLKATSFETLRHLLSHQRFPRAVALVEGLAQRFPEDPEVRQWHAITYYRWGHDLINQGNLKKAEACLKKAHRIDPHNKSLGQAIQQDFQRLAQLSQNSVA